MLKAFVAKFTDKEIVSLRIGNKHFLVSESLMVNKLEKEPKYVGLFLGEEIEEQFYPGFGLMDWLSNKTVEKVYVKDIGEMDFLYGKNLRSRHIAKVTGSQEIGYLKLVQNEKDENLGYGKIVGVLDKTNQFLKHRLDRGDFLKRDKLLEKRQKKA